MTPQSHHLEVPPDGGHQEEEGQDHQEEEDRREVEDHQGVRHQRPEEPDNQSLHPKMSDHMDPHRQPSMEIEP